MNFAIMHVFPYLFSAKEVVFQLVIIAYGMTLGTTSVTSLQHIVNFDYWETFNNPQVCQHLH